MGFSLLRLSLGQMADIAASRRPAGLVVDVADGTLPPDFIGRAALDQIAAGHSPQWCAVFLIVRDADALVVGSCCFKDEPREGRVEVGYGIAPAFRRQGAASEALRALVQLAAAGGARQVLAEVSPDNLASTALVAKLGFVRAGIRVDEDQDTVVQWLARLTA